MALNYFDSLYVYTNLTFQSVDVGIPDMLPNFNHNATWMLHFSTTENR